MKTYTFTARLGLIGEEVSRHVSGIVESKLDKHELKGEIAGRLGKKFFDEGCRSVTELTLDELVNMVEL